MWQIENVAKKTLDENFNIWAQQYSILINEQKAPEIPWALAA